MRPYYIEVKINYVIGASTDGGLFGPLWGLDVAKSLFEQSKSEWAEEIDECSDYSSVIISMKQLVKSEQYCKQHKACHYLDDLEDVEEIVLRPKSSELIQEEA